MTCLKVIRSKEHCHKPQQKHICSFPLSKENTVQQWFVTMVERDVIIMSMDMFTCNHLSHLDDLLSSKVCYVYVMDAFSLQSRRMFVTISYV